MLDENGVAGEVAVDDGRLAGVQVTAEKAARLRKTQENVRPRKEKLSPHTLSSPESGQDLRAPAFPGLPGAKKQVKGEKRSVAN